MHDDENNATATPTEAPETQLEEAPKSTPRPKSKKRVAKPKKARAKRGPKKVGVSTKGATKGLRKAKKATRKSASAAVSASDAGKKTKKVKKVAPKKNATGKKRGPRGNKPEDVIRNGEVGYGKRVRAARKAKELAQWQLAEKLGVTQPSICNVEKGTIKAGPKMKAALKKALGVE